MTELKFYLLCFIIAAPQGALGSAAHSHSGAPISRGADEEYTISLPPDSEFVEKRVRSADFSRNSITDYTILTNTHEECLSEAISRGVHAFAIDIGGCHFYMLKTPICNKWEEDELIYIRKDMLSDGSPSDNATYELEKMQMHVPDDVLRYYRIESPTILEFGNLRRNYAPPAVVFQYLAAFDGENLMYSDSPVLADSSCYTTSTCSEIFLTTTPEIPASDLFILHDICGQTIEVDSGRSIYVLSHEGIGCKNFPNDYPVADCWVKFMSDTKLKINVTFVNFRESDHCDGFTLAAVNTRHCATRMRTDLCDAATPTELTSECGKIRFKFGGSASPTREKYGFHFQVTAT